MPAESEGLHPLAQAAVDAHAVTAPKDDAASRARIVDLLETFESDMAPHLAPIIDQLLANPAIPDELRPLLGALTAPTHFGESVVIGIAIGATLSPVLQTALAPTLQLLANTVWHNVASAGGSGATIRPSADLLAAAALKGVLDPATAAGIAAYSGTSGEDFNTIFETAGQSLGFEQALLLERRGQLAPETLLSVLQYSNVNKRFYDAAQQLIYDSPSTGEVLTGALKHHLTGAQPLDLYKQAGGNPDNYDWQLASLGRPLGLVEMLDLMNRGFMTSDEVKQGIAQSDINDAYTDFALHLATYYPPVRSILPMLRAQAITPDQATKYWNDQGVPPELQAIMVKEAAHTKTGGVKELTQSQRIAEYEAGIIDAATATAAIELLGYSAADAAALVQLADEKKLMAERNATVRMIGSRYVARKITIQEAATLLGQVPVPAAKQAELVKLWDLERQTSVHIPSPAQIVGAYRRNEIGPAETKTRLLALGIDQADLKIFVADGWPPTKPATATVIDAVVNA